MMINNAIHSYQNVQYVSKPDANIAADSADGTNNSLPVTAPTTVSVSDEAQQMRAKEREIASRYDVTNMSENELIEMSKELYDNKLIDGKQYLMMTFPYSKSENDPEAAAAKKINMLDLKKSQLEFTLSHGGDTKEGIAIRRDEINVLERMKYLRG